MHDQPTSWASQVRQGEGLFRYVDGGRAGGKCLMIRSDTGGDLSWMAQVEVEPDSIYRLSGWIRTEGVEPGQGRGALLHAEEIQGRAAISGITGTHDWTRVETLVATDEHQQISVHCLLGGGGPSTGRAWYDDIRIERTDAEEIVPVVTIHADHAGSPLDPRIYGQSIEHPGPDVEGRIWAEMLADRKFYFQITPEAAGPGERSPELSSPVPGASSPWQIIGLASRVAMTKKDPSARQYTPHIPAGAGLRQHGLAVARGRDYAGHVWLAASGPGASVDVALVWGEGASDRHTVRIKDLPSEYHKYPLRFVGGASTDQAMLEIFVKSGYVLVGTISLMPADNIGGLRAETLKLLRQLAPTVLCWHTGDDDYDWRDGIGERDQRSPRSSPAPPGVQDNDFGLDEFIGLCRAVGAEPAIALTARDDDATSNAQMVEYCNGATDTAGGSRRAKNGRRKPYGVTLWDAGAESSVPWRLFAEPADGQTGQDDQMACLQVATALHEYFRTGNVPGPASCTPAPQTLACIQIPKTGTSLCPSALPLMLYRRQYGSIPVEVTGVHTALALDIAAAWTDSRKALTLSVVNPTNQPKTLQWKLDGATLRWGGTMWTIQLNRGANPLPKIVERRVPRTNRWEVPPQSITLLRLPASPRRAHPTSHDR